MDSSGNPVTTWIDTVQTPDPPRPNGAINGNTITGWFFGPADDRSDNWSFLTGDGFNANFFGGPFDSTAVMTTPYTKSMTGLTLNPAGIDHFNLYWGRTVLLASTASAATPVPTLPAYGLVLTVLGLLVLAGRRLRASAKRR